MKALIPVFDEKSSTPIYMQLYQYIKSAILSGEIVPNEKLPSLRNLSSTLNISLTTVNLAYSQLDVEGYIHSRPQSGYFVSDISTPTDVCQSHFTPVLSSMEIKKPEYLCDIDCFDFNRWKKCINKVLTLYPHLLLSESDPQGEEPLRHEIAKYIYSSRGVKCSAEQIVIAAGTQQITNHLSNILNLMDISLISVEDPGYTQVRNIFRDRGFSLSYISVLKDGIDISCLPSNIRSAVYVNPSNQFPTGAVMPIGNRYRLLKWAVNNNSFIIEDDYNSELRYFGNPIPSLQGLDNGQRVIYLGSFSSTLFASAKISYMVLPDEMAKLFRKIMKDYSQSCSKTEQLALAFFMEEGKYQTGIKKLRRLYSKKLSASVSAFEKYSKGFVTPVITSSGINMLISVKSKKNPSLLEKDAKSLGMSVVPAGDIYGQQPNSLAMVFNYNPIPLNMIDEKIKTLCGLWLDI